jgi:hypothetical protein
MSKLPLALSNDTFSFGGSNSIIGSMRGVSDNMSSCSSVTRCTRGRTSPRMLAVTSSSVSCNCSSTNFIHFYLTTHPSAPCFNGFARSIVSRIFFLEIGKHMLSALSSPEHQ